MPKCIDRSEVFPGKNKLFSTLEVLLLGNTATSIRYFISRFIGSCFTVN